MGGKEVRGLGVSTRGRDQVCIFFFFKQKTAYEILTCDWSSDVCSSDLAVHEVGAAEGRSPEAAPSFCCA